MINEYEKYKESGVEWIGEIPTHWHKLKLGRCFNIIGSGTTPNTSNNSYYEGGDINWLNTGDLNDGFIIETSKKITQLAIDEISTLKLFPSNSIVIALYGATIGKLGHLKISTTTNQACCVLTNSNFIENRYLFYFLLSSREFIISKAYGGGQPNISQDLIKQLYITTPPKAEQTQIAKYLDHQTTIIDDLIKQKEKLIELLKEKRKSVINEAVTKGLNPKAKMKDSGIEWLGEVPEDWELVPLKHLGTIKYGLGQPPKYKEGGLPLIRATNVERGKIVTKDLVFVDPDDVPFERDPVLRENDIIVVRSGAYTADSAIIPKEYEGAITGYDMVIRAKKVHPKLLAFSLLSYYLLNNQLFLKRMRSAQPHLNAEELGESFLLLPPRKQQTDIVTFLDYQVGRIEDLGNRINVAISKLKEYRQSIISEAVTGKVDVREWQPNKLEIA